MRFVKALAVLAFFRLILFWGVLELLGKGIWAVLLLFRFLRFRRVDFYRLRLLHVHLDELDNVDAFDEEFEKLVKSIAALIVLEEFFRVKRHACCKNFLERALPVKEFGVIDADRVIVRGQHVEV